MRFSLRALLIVLTLFGVWLGFRVNVARRQARAIAEITKQRQGQVTYDFETQAPLGEAAQSWVPQWILARTGPDLFHVVVWARMDFVNDYERADTPQIVADMNRHVAALPRLTHLTILVGPEASEGCLEAASHAARLEFLRCSNATDAGVAHLCRLRHLTFVGLDDSDLTDDALRTIGRMPQIEGLSVQNNHFTDTGLANLSNLQSLTHLSIDTIGIDQTNITDAGLVHLESVQRLTYLSLLDTHATPQGVVRLQHAVPSLKSVNLSPTSP